MGDLEVSYQYGIQRYFLVLVLGICLELLGSGKNKLYYNKCLCVVYFVGEERFVGSVRNYY